MGPFAYLHNRVRDEIEQARFAGITAQAALDWAMTLYRTACEQSLDRAHVCMPAELRAGLRNESETRAIQSSDPDEREWLRRAYRLALDGPDPIIRGTCWLAVAMASRDPAHAPILTECTARAFVDRFHARREFLSELVAGANYWLWELEAEIERPRRERAANDVWIASLHKLIGSNAIKFAALGPHEAAGYLEAEDAACRLGAIAVLSRTIRVPAVRSACIRRAIDAVGTATVTDLREGAGLTDDAPQVDMHTREVYARRIREMVESDSDPRVRSAAAQGLGLLYFRSCDGGIERFLARIALDRSQLDHTRYMACHALAMVRALPVSDWPIERARARSTAAFVALKPLFDYESISGDAWETDVDWGFVTGCASSTEPDEKEKKGDSAF